MVHYIYEGRGARPPVTFGSNVISGKLSICDLSSCRTVVTVASLTYRVSEKGLQLRAGELYLQSPLATM